MEAEVTEAGVDAMTVERITGTELAERIMRRRRKVQLIMDLETEDERQAVARAETALATARQELADRREPYLAEIAQAERLLFDWFSQIADTLEGPKTKKLLIGGAWGAAGSGFLPGRGRVAVSPEAVQAIAEAKRLAEDLEDAVVLVQAQVETLADAFPWLPDYCAETDLEGAQAAVRLLSALVQMEPRADLRAAGEILDENPHIACDALQRTNSAAFVLDGEKIKGAATGKPLTIAWPPAPAKGGDQ